MFYLAANPGIVVNVGELLARIKIFYGASAVPDVLVINYAGTEVSGPVFNGENLANTFNGLTRFARDAIASIRDAETTAGAPGHIIFFEQGVMGLPVAFDLGDDNLVFAPHNYAESIGPSFDGLLELMFLYYNTMSRLYGTPLWIGEYNKFSDQETSDAWLTRYSELEDRWLQDGGTWWQWE